LQTLYVQITGESRIVHLLDNAIRYLNIWGRSGEKEIYYIEKCPAFENKLEDTKRVKPSNLTPISYPESSGFLVSGRSPADQEA